MEGIREREKRRVPAGVAASMLSPEVRYAGDEDHVLHIHLSQLHEFEGHTFSVRETSEDFEALVESVKANGVETPLIVRPYHGIIGEYEIISGHRRHQAAKHAEIETVPVLIREVDDTQATILMAESNIQRPDWLPSERAKTYKVWLEAMKKKTGISQGCRTDRTLGSDFLKLSDVKQLRDLAPKRFNISGKMLETYIKLNDLIPDLLELVDYCAENPKCGIQVMAGYQLTFLSPVNQQVVLSVLTDYPDKVLKEPQAKAIRAAAKTGHLTAMDVEELLGFRPSDSGEAKVKPIKLILPDTYTERLSLHANDPELLECICKAVDAYLEEMEEK